MVVVSFRDWYGGQWTQWGFASFTGCCKGKWYYL